MIPRGVQVFLALETIDLRWSFDRLCGAALEQVGYDARGGALFVFFGKRKSAIKVLFFDGSARAYDTFRIPGVHEKIDTAEIQWRFPEDGN